ncbi:uroporphyrinogen-III C-methyltransferase [Solitalea koreensis]|uniref:uroporphyrinogen-III C-methyltransferase n=1 Tax=Solitalea koreensis TaxID=543615 RepID=A0A521D8E4_9SPHI|nr:uroporphyrinogen-III C-methyltransferase [Solitalea koreensis]SMO67986.1 uroporphyrin-III C-methyltransferase [Solitalea koreensis]
MRISKDIQPKLTLVGAGPGDPDLLTIKGLKALADADVVLFDALANEELLKYASKHAELISVGKRAGKHSMKQEQINQLIVSKAFQKGHVVRLKGGDPFIFGRGYEEIEYADAFGITTYVIPGISSTYAVPELQKIPVTLRGVSESFWVITGTTASGEISKDIQLAAQSTATVIILMGMSKLAEISAVFSHFGKAGTPAAIIMNGSTDEEKASYSSVENLVDMAQNEQLSNPAIIVIGEVVRWARNSAYFEQIAALNKAEG